MNLRPLPPKAQELCQRLAAPPRLIQHLTLVHDVAVTLTQRLHQQYPTLQVDAQAVAFGAATHDLGKTLHPNELSGPGDSHELDGPSLLENHGVPPELARFARTHGRGRYEGVTIEDLLVALADTVWKGKRSEELELRIIKAIALIAHTEEWKVFEMLDQILTDLASKAEQRLARQFRA
jgi:hypothetical protein